MTSTAKPNIRKFLIVSLPPLELEGDVRQLEIDYVLLEHELTDNEATLLRACTEEPFQMSDNTRGGGTQFHFAMLMLDRHRRTVKWTEKMLAERKPEEDAFTLYDVAPKAEMAKYWPDMPEHDYYLPAQILTQCHEDREDYVDSFDELLRVWRNIIESPPKRGSATKSKERLELETALSQLTAEDFILDDDSDDSDFESGCASHLNSDGDSCCGSHLIALASEAQK